MTMMYMSYRSCCSNNKNLWIRIKNDDNELDEVCDDEGDFIDDELDDIEQLLNLERDVELLIDESDKELFEQQLLIDDEDEDAMDDEDEKEQLKLDSENYDDELIEEE